jgi:hypothetical protein
VDENNTAYVGTDIGVFVKPVSEPDWQPFFNGLPRAPVSELMVNNTSNTIIACTYGRGNWQAATWTTCPATGTLVLGGTLIGQRFYEYNSIASTSVVTGGIQTDVNLKGVDYVQLNEGFNAVDGVEFKAYIGPCGNGGVPTVNSLDEKLLMEQLYIPAANGKRYPYGKINTVDNVNRTSKITISEAGIYSLRLTDRNGNVINTIFSDRKYDKGVYQINLNEGVSAGAYYLQLFKDLQVVHFQEYVPM